MVENFTQFVYKFCYNNYIIIKFCCKIFVKLSMEPVLDKYSGLANIVPIARETTPREEQISDEILGKMDVPVFPLKLSADDLQFRFRKKNIL